MDDDIELIVRLCTQAGMIMEDASIIAITLRDVPGAQMEFVLDRLLDDTRNVLAMIEAAQSIHRMNGK